jgi:hypothetical protein
LIQDSINSQVPLCCRRRRHHHHNNNTLIVYINNKQKNSAGKWNEKYSKFLVDKARVFTDTNMQLSQTFTLSVGL